MTHDGGEYVQDAAEFLSLVAHLGDPDAGRLRAA